MPILSLTRRSVLAVLLLGTPVATAIGYDVVVPGDQGTTSRGAIAPIQELNQSLIAVMKAGTSESFQGRMNMLSPVISKVFDLPYILRTSVGLSWSKLTAEQQAALLAVFRNYTVATYVDNFDSYGGQQFTINPVTRPLGTGQQVVSTQIVPRSGSPHTLDYVMRKTPAGWQVVDVLADGSISRVAVQRSDFSALLSRGGAPALEASLQRKTQTLSRG